MAAIENNKYNKYIYIILTILFCFGSLFISKSFVFASEVDYIIISEILFNAQDADTGKEFVELYNPTVDAVDLSNWSLKYVKDGLTEMEPLATFSPKDKTLIYKNGFFLVGFNNYEASNYNNISADVARSASLPNGENKTGEAQQITIILLNNQDNEVDKINYDKNSIIVAGQSLERKALQDGVCVSAQSSGEFLGNGCDAAGDISDFEIRNAPNPQNSGSPKEPPENELPENKPPIVEILSPENDSVYTEGEIINFKAEASDLEDGAVRSENIIWKEGDTELGKGNEMEIKNLAVGSRTITLEVQDSGGGKTIKEITIRIISAQNAEDSGEENEVGDGQNNSNREDETNSGDQNNSPAENAASSNISSSGGSGSSSSSYIAITLPKIIITEFLPDPEDSDKDSEFVEIYNSDSAEVDLSKWTLEDKLGQTKKFTIAEGVKIKPGKYRVFYSDETRITLNNSRDGVVLRDNKGNIISETPICNLAQEEQSYALDENSKWVFTLRPTPGRKNIIKAESKNISEEKNKETKKESEIEENPDEKNSQIPELNSGQALKQSLSRTCFGIQDDNNKEEQYDFSDRIIISEICPNPKGRDNAEGNYEWIELYNDSDEDVNLKGWQIDDILKKGSKPYVINNDTVIKAKGYLVFSNADTKLMLNNLGDEVNILWPDAAVADSVKYDNVAEGLSYNLSSGGEWVWSLENTPGGENIIKAETADEHSGEISPALNSDATISKIGEGFEENETDGDINYIETTADETKKLPRHTLVKIAGTVSAPPGVFSDKTFYISGSGIQIYSYEAEIPALNIGDKVEIIGRVSEIGGELRILLGKTEDVKIVSRGNLVEPKIIFTGSIGESNEGYLAAVEGKVTKAEGNMFFIDDGSGEIKVYIKPQTGILKPDIKEGDWLAITGQVSQTSAGYRILPRFQGDIKIAKASGVSTSKTSLQKAAEKKDKNGDEKSRTAFYSFPLTLLAMLILMDWGKMRWKQMASSKSKITNPK